MQQLSITALKPHPRNEEFFDNITGDNWTEFLKSIQTSGVIEPVICTQDNIIVSGHQRVRACAELGMESVACEVRTYDDEDRILKDLLETNLRQRGIGNTNPIKMARCIKELERIYDIQNGGDRKSDRYNVGLIQAELAQKLGITEKQLQRYKKLLDLVPELQEAVETGKISPTTVAAVFVKLSQSEQQQIIQEYGKDYISSLTKAESEDLVNNWIIQNEQLQQQVSDLQNQIAILQEEKGKSENSADIQYLERQVETLKAKLKKYQNRDQEQSNQNAISDAIQPIKDLCGRLEKELTNTLPAIHKLYALVDAQQMESTLKWIYSSGERFTAQWNDFLQSLADKLKSIDPKYIRQPSVK